MYWIKQLFEGSLTLRDYDGQVAEATCAEQHGEGRYARKRAYCLKIQPATGSFARNLIYSTKPCRGRKHPMNNVDFFQQNRKGFPGIDRCLSFAF